MPASRASGARRSPTRPRSNRAGTGRSTATTESMRAASAARSRNRPRTPHSGSRPSVPSPPRLHINSSRWSSSWRTERTRVAGRASGSSTEPSLEPTATRRRSLRDQGPQEALLVVVGHVHRGGAQEGPEVVVHRRVQRGQPQASGLGAAGRRGELVPPGDAVGRSADQHGRLEREAQGVAADAGLGPEAGGRPGHVDGHLGGGREEGHRPGPAAGLDERQTEGPGLPEQVPEAPAGDGLQPHRLVLVAPLARAGGGHLAQGQQLLEQLELRLEAGRPASAVGEVVEARPRDPAPHPGAGAARHHRPDPDARCGRPRAAGRRHHPQGELELEGELGRAGLLGRGPVVAVVVRLEQGLEGQGPVPGIRRPRDAPDRPASPLARPGPRCGRPPAPDQGQGRGRRFGLGRVVRQDQGHGVLAVDAHRAGARGPEVGQRLRR